MLLFLVAMTTSYHLYTIYFSGFNPINYMMIWYTLTLISPILSYICWYAKGNSKIALLINTFILLVAMRSSFSIEIWYFDLNKQKTIFFYENIVLIWKITILLFFLTYIIVHSITWYCSKVIIVWIYFLTKLHPHTWPWCSTIK